MIMFEMTQEELLLLSFQIPEISEAQDIKMELQRFKFRIWIVLMNYFKPANVLVFSGVNEWRETCFL